MREISLDNKEITKFNLTWHLCKKRRRYSSGYDNDLRAKLAKPKNQFMLIVNEVEGVKILGKLYKHNFTFLAC